MTHQRTDRRAFLLGAAHAAVAAVALAACASDADEAEASTPPPTRTPASEIAPVPALTAAMFDSASGCRLTPSSTAGPYPSTQRYERRDIHDGYPGHPLRLGLRVVDASCRPVTGADVGVWHTDATGDYSEYIDDGSGKDEGEESTFCRGNQITDDDGIVEFQTIYPGWYEGRAVHVHVEVRLDRERALTAQLYFDEDYSAGVYASGVYAEFGLPDTPWSRDRIVEDPTTDGTGLVLAPGATHLGTGTLGLATLTIG